MQHERQGHAALRQLAIGVLGATAILVLVRVASETDWSREMVTTLVRSSLISGLIGFSLLFGLEAALAGQVRTRAQLIASFAGTILVGVAVIAAVVPTLNWLMGSMIAPNAPGESRSDFTAFLSENFVAVYWRLVVIMGPLFAAFNWRWFAERLDRAPDEAMALQPERPAVAEPGAPGGDAPALPIEESAEEWLVNKLAMPKRGALWAISSELHYIRIYTDVADDLVLMRLSDAVERLSASDGIQIHRSHWVARAGIRDLVKTGGGLEIELHNGVRLPVSRPNAASVRAFCKSA